MKSLLFLLMFLPLVSFSQKLEIYAVNMHFDKNDLAGLHQKDSGYVEILEEENKIEIVTTNSTSVFKILSFSKDSDIVTYQCETRFSNGAIVEYIIEYDIFYKHLKTTMNIPGGSYTVYYLR